MSLLIAMLAAISTPTYAAEVVNVPIQQIYISEKYSDKDDVYLKAEFLYPNGCYETYNSLDREGANENKIMLEQKVIIRDGMCTMQVVSSQSFFNLEEYNEGQYTLVDAFDKKVIGELIVDSEGDHEINPAF